MTVLPTLAAAILWLPSPPVAPVQDESSQIEQLLDAASMAYWAAIHDHGSLALLDLGLEHVQAASNLIPADALELRARADQVALSLAAQRDMSRDTLRTIFPTYRLLAAGMGHEVLVDEPWIVATTRASDELLEALQTSFGRYGQLDTIGAARFEWDGDHRLLDPIDRRDYLNEAIYVLSSGSKTWVHEAASPAALADVAPHGPSLSLRLSDEGTLPPLWAVTSAAELFIDGHSTGEEVRAIGFALDRRDRLIWIILAPTALLLVAVTHALGVRRRRGSSKDERRSIALAASAAFLAGTIAALFGLYFLRPHLPSPDALATTSIWGPALIALVASGLPLIVLQIAPSRLSHLTIKSFDYWDDPAIGAWPALLGGGALAVAASSLELDLPTAAAAISLWALSQRHAAQLMRDDAPDSRMENGALLSALILALGLAIIDIPSSDWGTSTLSWIIASLVIVFAIAKFGADALGAAIAPMSTLALLGGSLEPLGVLAIGPIVARVLRRRSNAPTTVSHGPVVDSETLEQRLTHCRENHALPTAINDALTQALAQKNRSWVEVAIVSGHREDRQYLASAAACRLLEQNKPLVLSIGDSSADPLAQIEARMPRSADRKAQIIKGVIHDLSGLAPREQEEDQRIRDLARRTAQLAAEQTLPRALITSIEGELNDHREGHRRARRFVEELRNPVKHSFQNGDSFGHVVTCSDPESYDSSLSLLENCERFSVPEDLHHSFLQGCLGFETEHASFLLEATREFKLGLASILGLIEKLVEAGALSDGAQGNIPLPPLKDRQKYRSAISEAAEAVAAERSRRAVEDLEREPREALDAAAHFGARFRLSVVAEALGISTRRLAQQFDGIPHIIADDVKDDWLMFVDGGLPARLRQAQRHRDDRERWSQAGLETLRALIITYERILQEGTSATSDDLMCAGALVRSLGQPDGTLGQAAEAAHGICELIVANHQLLRPRSYDARALLESLFDYVYRGLPIRQGWNDEQRAKILAAALTLEKGSDRLDSLPYEQAERCLAELGSLSPWSNAEADLILCCIERLVDANRFGAPQQVSSPISIDAVLEELIASHDRSAIRVRALLERGRLTHRRVKSRAGQLDGEGGTGAAAVNALYKRALDDLQQAFEGAQESGHLELSLASAQALGDALSIPPGSVQGRPLEERARNLEKALNLARKHGAKHLEARLLGTLGRAYLYEFFRDSQADSQIYRVAKEYFLKDLAVSRDVGDYDGEIQMHTSIAQCCWRLAEWEEAQRFAEEGREIVKRLRGGLESLDGIFCLVALAAESSRTGDEARSGQLALEVARIGAVLDAHGSAPGWRYAVLQLKRFYAPYLQVPDHSDGASSETEPG